MEKVLGVFRPARVQIAPTPWLAAVAPPFVGSEFLVAGVTRASDKGPFPVGVAGTDVIACFGLPAARTDNLKNAHETLRTYDKVVIRAVDF